MRCGLLGWWHASCLGLLQGHFPKIGCLVSPANMKLDAIPSVAPTVVPCKALLPTDAPCTFEHVAPIAGGSAGTSPVRLAVSAVSSGTCPDGVVALSVVAAARAGCPG